MEIRAVTQADFPAMCAMGSEIGEQHHEAVPTLIKPDTFTDAAFAGLLADPSTISMVGSDKGEVVGYIIYKVVEEPEENYFYATRYLYIVELGVFRRHQRKGYGEALISHAVEAAKAQGVTRVTLRVWSFNDGAIAFYQRLGFAPQTMIMAREI